MTQCIDDRIRCPFWCLEHNTKSKWIANDIHSLQILHSCKFKICCLGLLFQTVAFRSFRPRTSMNLNRRKSVKIMRRATMTRTCPGWSWSTCSRPGIRHLSCHSWLCFLNNHVIMFVLFVSKHVFTFYAAVVCGTITRLSCHVSNIVGLRPPTLSRKPSSLKESLARPGESCSFV